MNWWVTLQPVLTHILALLAGLILRDILIKGVIWRRYNLYKKRRELIGHLLEEVKDSLERIIEVKPTKYSKYDSNFGKILFISKSKFKEFLEKRRDYDILIEATSMKVQEVVSKRFEDFKTIPEENRQEILKLIGYTDHENFVDRLSKWFSDNFGSDIVQLILNGKDIDSNWFIKEAGKGSWSIETKDKIKKLIDQSKEVSFEATLKKIENDLKCESDHGIIRILEKSRKDTITASKNLIKAIEWDLTFLRLFWLFLRTEENVLNEIQEALEKKYPAVV